jgi:hypothetical protein
MASLIITAGAILLSNYSQFIDFQIFGHISSLYLYKHSLVDLRHCSTDEWTFLLSGLEDHEIHCPHLVTSLPNIGNPHVLFAIKRTEDIFLIPEFQNICFQMMNNATVLSIGTDSHLCSPSIYLNYPLQFDPFLLTNWQSLLPLPFFSEFDLSHNSPLICASLEYSLLHNLPSTSIHYLTIISSLESNFHSLNFWINLCDLDSKIIAIHQRSIHSKQNPKSYCLVKKVSGGKSFDFFLKKNMKSHEASLICLEDIFPLLSHSTSSTTSASSSSSVLFLSPLGLNYLHPSSSLLESQQQQQQHVSDLNAFILAKQTHTGSLASLLCVHSALRGVVKYFLNEQSLIFKNHQIDDTLLTLMTSTNEQHWQQSFSTLTFQMRDWLDSDIFEIKMEPINKHLKHLSWIWNLRNRYLFIQSFDQVFEKLSSSSSSSSPSEIILSDPFSRFLFGNTLLRYVSYLTPFSDSSSSSSSTLHFPHKNYFSHFGQYLLNQQLLPPFSQEHRDICQVHEILSYDLSDFSVVTTTSHILIFVTSTELFQSRNLLLKWRSECQYCPLVVQFAIYILPDNDVMSPLDVMTSSRHEYRQILLTLHDYLVHAVVEPDVVIVLVGLQAMKSFIQPGGDGLIPIPKVGGVSYLRLFAPLVFSSTHFHPSEESVSCSEINFNSFTGTAQQILHFLTHVLHHSSSTLSGTTDAFLRYASRDYIRRFRVSHRIRIDSKYQLFNSLYSATELFLPKQSLLFTRIGDYSSTTLRAYQDFTTATNFIVSERSSSPDPHPHSFCHPLWLSDVV